MVTNTNRIADMCDLVRPVPHNLFAPSIENSVEDLKNLVYTKFHRLYGDNPPELMVKRVETEMNDIISCHYDVIYMSAQKLVQNSLEHGYLVGSRGSVGSSIVAYMSGIKDLFRDYAQQFPLYSATVVDISRWLKLLKITKPLLADQVSCADTVIVNKVDVYVPTESDIATISELTEAPIILTSAQSAGKELWDEICEKIGC